MKESDEYFKEFKDFLNGLNHHVEVVQLKIKVIYLRVLDVKLFLIVM